MLGSHNSLSYLKPRRLLDLFTLPWSKCQNKNIRKQYETGVRYFDIRIKLNKGNWHFVHNIVDFGIEKSDVYDYLNRVKEKVYIRVILDQRKKPRDYKEQINSFKSHLYYLESTYTNIIFDSAIIFWEWKEYLDPKIKVVENHFSVKPKKWWEYILGTRFFARKVRKENVEEINDSSMVALKDYV